MAKKRTVERPDYGSDEINLLGDLILALDAMEEEARGRAFRFLKSRYSKDWPSDTY